MRETLQPEAKKRLGGVVSKQHLAADLVPEPEPIGAHDALSARQLARERHVEHVGVRVDPEHVRDVAVVRVASIDVLQQRLAFVSR